MERKAATNQPIPLWCGTHGEESEKELEAAEFAAHNDSVNACRLIHEDSVIITCSNDKTVALWNAYTGERLQVLSGHQNQVVMIDADDHRHRLLSASWDKSVTLWDYCAASKLWSGPHEALVTGCHLAPQRQLALAGCDNGYFYLWDIKSGKCVKSHKGHGDSILCCQFSHNELTLCTCSMDRSAAVWDIRMLSRLLHMCQHGNAVSSCVYSHHDRYLCTCSWDKCVRVFNIATGTYRSEGPLLLHNHEGCVSGCDFSSDDKLLVTCGFDQAVSVWDSSSFTLQSSMRGHTNWINDIRFGKNSRWIITASKDGKVKLWDLHAGSEGCMRRAEESVKCVVCGRYFTTQMLSHPSPKCMFCRTIKIDRSLDNVQPTRETTVTFKI